MIRRSWRLARIALQVEAEERVAFAARERQKIVDEMQEAAWAKALNAVKAKG